MPTHLRHECVNDGVPECQLLAQQAQAIQQLLAFALELPVQVSDLCVNLLHRDDGTRQGRHMHASSTCRSSRHVQQTKTEQ